MAGPATVPPPRRPELVLSPCEGTDGYVVKDPRTGEYFRLGAPEAFLLSQLDGRQSAAAICTAFAARFGESLSEDELQDFVDLARSRHFLSIVSQEAGAASVVTTANVPGPRQSLLYWRKPLFDPDRLFTWLAPRIACVWAPGFLVVTLAVILVAAGIAWGNRAELVTYFASALTWQTLLLVWATLLLVTMCHECAHGLTCKHYGGEVHEIGFLLVCLLPCLYCNVSDAWLFPQKKRRLLVTLAGAYCDLLMWSLAVFAWRLTVQDSLPNYLAWVVLSVVGARIAMNFNPLIKLDGYYLLSDWLEIPNLQGRAWTYVLGRVRTFLWGAPPPEPDPRAGTLLAYGAFSWLFSMALLTFILLSFVRYLGAEGGWLGAAVVVPLGVLALRGPLGGLTGGEVQAMLANRRRRALAWGCLAIGAMAFLGSGQVDDRAGGPLVLRPAIHTEVRAPVAGFLRVAACEEGDRLAAGALVAIMEVPNLDSRLRQKQAERREAEARLQLLEVGPRPEERTAQHARIERARAWRDLAQRDLERARRAFDAEIARLDRQLAQYRAEWENARDDLHVAEELRGKRTIADEEFRAAIKREQVARAQRDQAQAQKRSRQATGTQDAEAELARRERELAEAEAALTLLEAGTRPEEIKAERAHLARVREELQYEETLQKRSRVTTPVGGLVLTPRMHEHVGLYFHEGDLICEIEDPAAMTAEVALTEQDIQAVVPGQSVEFKVQALPFQTFVGHVLGTAPRAVRTGLQTEVTVYCQLDDPSPTLCSGMSGYARIAIGRRPLREVVATRILRFLRMEFWW